MEFWRRTKSLGPVNLTSGNRKILRQKLKHVYKMAASLTSRGHSCHTPACLDSHTLRHLYTLWPLKDNLLLHTIAHTHTHVKTHVSSSLQGLNMDFAFSDLEFSTMCSIWEAGPAWTPSIWAQHVTHTLQPWSHPHTHFSLFSFFLQFLTPKYVCANLL